MTLKDMPQGYIDAVEKAADLHKAGRFDEAGRVYNDCLGYNPDDPFLLYLVGSMFLHMGMSGVAIQLLRTAVAIDATRSEAWHNLGVAYRNEEHSDRAIASYKKGIKLDPDNSDLLAMMSGAHVNEDMAAEGAKWAKRALKVKPDNPHALNHLALCLLEQGKYAEGWKAYENRWSIPERVKDRRHYSDTLPKWYGLPTDRLIIHGEQGLGDEILFMSCFNEVWAAEPEIECAKRLVPLFERSFGVKCYPTDDAVKEAGVEYDNWIPMGDLPGFFRRSKEEFSKAKPFLKADPDKVKHWRSMMESQGDGPYVLVCWAGGAKITSQGHRNPPLPFWETLLKEDATFISGQYTAEAKAQASEWDIPHWQEAIDDLDEFAALVEACDLVISPCQTAIHFAGGLGKECWCVTPDKKAWRYEGDMPWYPSVKLYHKNKDWGVPFQRIASDLRRLSRTESKAA